MSFYIYVYHVLLFLIISYYYIILYYALFYHILLCNSSLFFSSLHSSFCVIFACLFLFLGPGMIMEISAFFWGESRRRLMNHNGGLTHMNLKLAWDSGRILLR